MPVPGYTFRLLALAVILAVNGFFAAAEVSLLSVRESRLRNLEEEGVAGARAALALLARPEQLLSVTQIGVTLASLGLGWAGEDTLYGIIIAWSRSGWLHPVLTPVLTPALATWLHAAAFVVAFLAMTLCHVVIGEVVPKNVAIERADRLAILVAPVLMLFSRVMSPFIAVVGGSARIIGRMAGVRSTHRAGGHSAEELKLVVSSSRFAGNLPKSQEAMILQVLDLESLSVREIMQPRHDVCSIPATAGLDDVLKMMVESSHSRLPVWVDKPEQMVGVVYFKDMLRVWHERRVSLRAGRPPAAFSLLQLMRKPLFVPETKPLTQMLDEFRSRHAHLALVVDEFGTVTGLVTVEDVLEQIVGEIQDEFDDALPVPAPGSDLIEVEGTLSIRDFGAQYGIELPVDAGFETVAGYILSRIGDIPRPGQFADFEGRRYTVTRMDRNRIASVKVERLPQLSVS